jgi:hypothetical protein
MGIKSDIAPIIAQLRCAYLDSLENKAPTLQLSILDKLIKKGKNTSFGKEHDFRNIQSYTDFCQKVPVRTYEGIKPWIDRIYLGESNVLWPGLPNYLSKTSGTTAGSKYIPNTPALLKAQIAGARDALLYYIRESRSAKFLDGSMLFLSGSPELEKNSAGIPIGRLSGIVNHFIPQYLKRNQVPTWETNCLDDWELKIKGIVEETRSTDLRLISGIPPWVQNLLETTQNQTELPIGELWPNLQVFVYGGVDFKPYAPLFKELLPKNVHLWETYPASESFIALQDSMTEEGLRLMTSYGTFYEFIPMSEYGHEGARRFHLGEVQIGVQYALVLTNPAGLWAYDIGDTIRFTSLNPYRVVVTGRTSQFISAFGEHVIVEEINQAMEVACKQTQARVTEFIVMPQIEDSHSCHQWYIEFSHPPENLEVFRNILESTLLTKNSYYQDLISGNILKPLQVNVLQAGTCFEFMKTQGKLGGQNKFPRANNSDRHKDFFEKRAFPQITPIE